ncbi:TIGR02186 family protein [Rhodobacteraceae bacterium DSL-40]|uniref:TIGR02186 family protein n=1 Tax=Amaricoccus sp. B4 TaxID=3368557 RepID=UPI000DABEA4D
MIRRAALLLLALWLAAPVALAQETVVTGLSTENIALNATFDGSELFVFGAIRRDAPIPEDADPLDVIITIKGPVRPITVREKSRWFGIWVNRSAVRIRETPSFYAIASTRPMGDLLTETERLRYRIGMDQAVRKVESAPGVEDTRPFAEAVVRLREESGLYARLDGDVSLAEDTLFQTHIKLPSNIVEGDYVAEFFLVRDRKVISSGAAEIVVEKTGIERWLYNLAHNRPFIYGLFSVALALAAGWLAATAFRIAKR